MTYWVAGDGGIDGRASISWPAYGDDGGTTWVFGDPFAWKSNFLAQRPSYIQEDESFRGFDKGYFFSTAVMPSGERLLYNRSVINGRMQRIKSEDGGKTWMAPESVEVILPPDLGQANLICESASAVNSDGTIYIAGYGKMRNDNKWSCFLISSTNGGKRFEYVSTIATPLDAPWGNNGPCEPELLRISDSELICVMRTGISQGLSTDGTSVASDMLLARTRDRGATWSLRRMLIPGVMPKLRRLQNGIIVLATGRPGNSLYISTDEGLSFGREIVVTAPMIKTTGYCDIWEVVPNRILVVYDVINSPLSKFWLWEPVIGNGIYGQFVDIQRR